MRAFARSDARTGIGDAITEVELCVTVDGDEFTVHADPSELSSAYVQADGVLDFRVVAESGSGELFVDHSSARLSPAGGAARWGGDTDLTATRSRAAAVEVVQLGALARAGDAVVPAARTSAAACVPTVINSHLVKTRIGSTYPAPGLKARLLVERSSGGQYQVAMKVPNHPVQKMEMMHADGGWGARPDGVASQVHWNTRIQYLTIDNRYRATDGSCQYYLTYEPDEETGGLTKEAASRPQFTRCIAVARGGWKRIRSDGRPFALTYGVSAAAIVGVSLGVTKNYGESSHALVYRIPAGGGRMCGKDDYPAVASIVMGK
ncbi:hypothetical protein [Nocardioides sp. 1609]|uniref:hypothetical protein n=1 Tax=Nocardioides sp. 1609 TaxID=2508327 RepID=UPI0010705227|nr:hypothetical protein [Nocardioides sp. 1609]